MKLQNFSLEWTSVGGRPLIYADDGENRYHIWLSEDYKPMSDMKVYKNRIAGSTHRERRVPTIRLNFNTGMGKKIAALMMAYITPETIAAAEKVLASMTEQQNAERAASRKVYAIEKNAQAMFEALKRIIAQDPTNEFKFGGIAREAVAKIEKEAK